MVSTQAAAAQAGNSYVCVATCTKQSKEQQAAAAAISWPDAVAAVVNAGPVVAASTAVCTPAYQQPRRGRPAPPLKAIDFKLVEAASGKRVLLRGLNWWVPWCGEQHCQRAGPTGCLGLDDDACHAAAL